MCIYSIPPTVIRLGAHSISNPDEHAIEIAVKEIIDHVKYDPLYSYDDIALIRLENSPTLSPYLRPACLPSSRTTFLPNLAIASGWGALKYKGFTSDVLLKVDLPYVNSATCNQSFRDRPFGIKESQICYGGVRGKDSCSGDSGGPLQNNNPYVYCSYTVYGITSFGKECGLDIPGVYSNVSYYLDWIEQRVWPAN